MHPAPEPSPHPSRGAALSVGLSLVGAAFLLLVLIVITGGLVIYLLAVVGGFAVFAGLHYLLWGRFLHQATEGEREEADLRERARADGWDLPDGGRGPR